MEFNSFIFCLVADKWWTQLRIISFAVYAYNCVLRPPPQDCFFFTSGKPNDKVGKLSKKVVVVRYIIRPFYHNAIWKKKHQTF